VIFKLYDCATATSAAVCLARITFSFGESQVAECGHDLVSGRASVCEKAAEGLAKAMRPTIGRQSGLPHRIAHPTAVAVDREWLAPFGGQDTDVLARKCGKGGAKRLGFVDQD